MLIWPPRYTVKNVRSGREEMHHENLQLRPAERERRRIQCRGSTQEANTACFLSLQCQPGCTPTPLWPVWGGWHLVFRVDCIHPHITSTHTHTHTFQHHTRFYSWMKSINGSSERVARQWTRRPGRHANPGFPGLCYKKKKLSDPSGCTIKNETLVCTQKRACWVISQSRQVVLVSVSGL